jgi:hypothetical protein
MIHTRMNGRWLISRKGRQRKRRRNEEKQKSESYRGASRQTHARFMAAPAMLKALKGAGLVRATEEKEEKITV